MELENKITEIAFTKAKLPYGWLGNMTSEYPVVYNELKYPSTEALFQALRFPEDSELREVIRLEKNPFKGKLIAKANRDKMYIEPTGDDDINNMRLCIKLKIEQYPTLKDILIDSGDIPIYEDVTSRGRGSSNLIWGALKHSDGTWEGQNILGNLWMELRTQLQNEENGK